MYSLYKETTGDRLVAPSCVAGEMTVTDDIVREFEQDCTARIQALLKSKEPELQVEEGQLPSATVLMAGLVLGVVASRVACTTSFIPGRLG